MKDYFLRKFFPGHREGTAWRLGAAIHGWAYAGEKRCVDSGRGANRAPILGFAGSYFDANGASHPGGCRMIAASVPYQILTPGGIQRSRARR
jgi:hypothetical protein